MNFYPLQIVYCMENIFASLTENKVVVKKAVITKIVEAHFHMGEFFFLRHHCLLVIRRILYCHPLNLLLNAILTTKNLCLQNQIRNSLEYWTIAEHKIRIFFTLVTFLLILTKRQVSNSFFSLTFYYTDHQIST